MAATGAGGDSVISPFALLTVGDFGVVGAFGAFVDDDKVGASILLRPSLLFKVTGERGVAGDLCTAGDKGVCEIEGAAGRVGVLLSAARFTRAVKPSLAAVEVFGDRGNCGSAAFALDDAVPCNNLDPDDDGILPVVAVVEAGAEGADALL